MRTIEFENDVCVFKAEYTLTTPEENYYNSYPARLIIHRILLIGHTTEDAKEITLEEPIDVTYIVNDDVEKSFYQKMECYD